MEFDTEPMSVTSITLDNFKEELDENILERGWFYFKKGWVNKPKEIMPGYFESRVNEVSSYAVSFSLDKVATFTDDFCTCGEERTLMCRHKAAVLFWLEDESNSKGALTK